MFDFDGQGLENIILSRGAFLKSGWKSIFVVFSRAAQDSEPKILSEAFNVTVKINNGYLDHVGASFVDYVHCLVEFSLNPRDEEIALGAVRLILSAAYRHLEASKANTGEAGMGNTASDADNASDGNEENAAVLDDDAFYLVWFPIMSGLAKIMTDGENSKIRNKGIEALHGILKLIGGRLTPEYWRNVHRSVLLPMFEEVRDAESNRKREALPSQQSQHQQQASAVWLQCLRLLVDLFRQPFSPALLDSDIFDATLDFVLLLLRSRSESVEAPAFICLNQLVNAVALLPAREQHWDRITQTLERILELSLPQKLVDFGLECMARDPKDGSVSPVKENNGQASVATSPTKESGVEASPTGSSQGSSTSSRESIFRLAQLQFSVLLHLGEVLKDLLLSSNGAAHSGPHAGSTTSSSSLTLFLSDGQQDRWLDLLSRMGHFCRAFNENFGLRVALQRQGFNAQVERISLLKQEVVAVTASLGAKFEIYRLGRRQATESVILEPLLGDSIDLIRQYLEWQRESLKFKKALESWAPVIIAIYSHLLSFEWARDPSATAAAPEPDTPTESVDANNSGFPSKYAGLRKRMPEFFSLAVRLMAVDVPDLRQVLQHFMERMGSRFLQVQ